MGSTLDPWGVAATNRSTRACLLGLRLALALSGAAVALVSAALLLLVGHLVAFAFACAAVGALALVNAAVVARHRRSGAHYQPGPAVPAYRPLPPLPSSPDDGTGAGARGRRPPPTAGTRQRRYLILMGICLFLIVNAWTWVRLISVTAAAVMSMVACVMPPIAAMVANAGWADRSSTDRPPPDDSSPTR